MKRRVFPVLIALLLAACASQEDTTAASPPAVPSEAPTVAVATVTLPAPTVEARTQAAPGLEATPVPLATSRGPNLEATDPATVSLASGRLQFVEFFRFT